jgi:hypothetical protein
MVDMNPKKILIVSFRVNFFVVRCYGYVLEDVYSVFFFSWLKYG